MFTEKQINEILAVCEKATPGPWEVKDMDDCFIEPRICMIPGNGCYDYEKRGGNADFIALARTALPQLAEEVIKLLAVAEAGKISLRHCLPEPNEDEECVVCDGYPDACPQCEAGKLREALITLADAGYGGEE
jgi:hypothetical protein